MADLGGKLTNNTARSRYELEVDGLKVFADYALEGDRLIINWVEAPPALRGMGASGKLMTLLAEEAKRQGWRITPVCGYAAAWLRGSKTYRDLVA
jgi:predicted GNAT family acetyltransferase